MARRISGPLYYGQAGASGMPMLFLHSTPDDHRLWMLQTVRFSAWYRTVAVDLAGYGRSPAPQAGVTVADQAEACWEVIERISSDRIIIHGNSLGSFVAMHMANQRPEKIRAMILSGCGHLPTREMMVRWKTRYEQEGLSLRHGQIMDHFAPASREKPLVQYYANMVCELNNTSTLGSIIAMNAALSEPDPDELVTSIDIPTIVISGTADRNHPAAVELTKRIKGSELCVIEGAGHSLMIEEPAQYDEFAIAFLKKLGLYPGS
jgi:pimeloyl-ACP methyl ester carboxylesterase